MSIRLGRTTADIRQNINKKLSFDDLLLIITTTSERLESLLSGKLCVEKGLPFDKVTRFSLGQLLDWCSSMNIMSKNQNAVFNKLRNQVVHNREACKELVNDPQLEKKVKEVLMDTLNYIDKTYIELTQEIMNQGTQTKYMQAFTQKFQNFKSDLNSWTP